MLILSQLFETFQGEKNWIFAKQKKNTCLTNEPFKKDGVKTGAKFKKETISLKVQT